MAVYPITEPPGRLGVITAYLMIYVVWGSTYYFIGATGIAVRVLAPLVNDKFCDPAVVVIDEREQPPHSFPFRAHHQRGRPREIRFIQVAVVIVHGRQVVMNKGIGVHHQPLAHRAVQRTERGQCFLCALHTDGNGWCRFSGAGKCKGKARTSTISGQSGP